MNWVRAIAAVLVLWSGTAWAATLTWTANSEPDLGGYRVYQCSLQPCTKSSGNESLLVTLGTGTSFNIGTPAVTQYYFITAYDFTNNESSASNLVTFTPAGAPPPPFVGTVKVVGNPTTGPWGVEASTTDPRDVMVGMRLDGVFHHADHTAPFGFPADNGTTATTGLFGIGSHTVEFFFRLEKDTTTLIGRTCVTVQEGTPPSVETVTLNVVGNPATGPWGVEGFTTDPRDVMARVNLDGDYHHTDHTAPYGFPDDNGTTATTGLFGIGSHSVVFVFLVQGTNIVVGRACVTVGEGIPAPPSVKTVTLNVVGNPATGPWGVNATTTDPRDVMATVLLDGVVDHVEHYAPYDLNDPPKLYGTGPHTVEFVFYVEGTTTEIGRANVTVREGAP